MNSKFRSVLVALCSLVFVVGIAHAAQLVITPNEPAPEPETPKEEVVEQPKDDHVFEITPTQNNDPEPTPEVTKEPEPTKSPETASNNNQEQTSQESCVCQQWVCQ